MGNTTDQTNQRLITGFKKNDSFILEGVYARVFPKIKVHILKNNGDENQAKDIYQEAFIACWKSIKANKLSEDGNVEAYLYRIAKNKWTDYLRSSDYKKRASNTSIIDLTKADDENSEVELDQEEENRIVMRKALQQLGRNCKTLLNLFYYERKSMNEISQVMNLASSSARNQKYRCMEKLRKLSLEIKNNG